MSDRMKSSRAEIPLLAVGGGAHLIADRVPGISEVLRPESYSVANAYGACIAEASGTVDRVYSYDRSSREECLDDAKELAANAAVRSGAHPDRIRITAVTEVPMTYVPGGGCRVMVKAVGAPCLSVAKGMTVESAATPLPIADSHNDLLLACMHRRERGCVDPFGDDWLPGLRAGNVVLQVLPIFTEEQFVGEGALRRTLRDHRPGARDRGSAPGRRGHRGAVGGHRSHHRQRPHRPADRHRGS